MKLVLSFVALLVPAVTAHIQSLRVTPSLNVTEALEGLGDIQASIFKAAAGYWGM
jgi:hypothetical protein